MIIDEAGQCTEPECLVPIALVPHGKIVLAGDPMQLGPVLRSTLAKHYSFDISLMERLMQTPLYTRDTKMFANSGDYDARFVTKLTDNYRSHEMLLRLPSKLFYHNELVPCASQSEAGSLSNWNRLPCKGCPLIFHAITGNEMRENDSPSFFNAQEVVLATRYAKQLVNEKSDVISADDIAIITPYRKQVEKIRMMLRQLGLKDVKVSDLF